MHICICIYICILTLDPQNLEFVLTSSVEVQRRRAFIRGQKGPRMTRQTDIKSQKAHGELDGRTDGRTYYTATQGISTCGLWPHALRAITSCMNELLLLI